MLLDGSFLYLHGTQERQFESLWIVTVEGEKMPFTRQFIRNSAKECDVDLPKELIDTLISEHMSAQDTYAEDRVKKALEENKPAEPTPVKESDEYKALQKEYDDYKSKVEGEKAQAKKRDAYRAMLEEVGISEKRIESVLKVSDIDKIELDEDGKIKDVADLKKAVKAEWSDFITKDEKRGIDTPTPPAGVGTPGEGKQNSRAVQIANQYYERLYGKKAEETR